MLGPVRFTEREMTAALQGAAKQVLAAKDKDVRKGRRTVDEAWTALTTHQRYVLLDGLGTQVLPALVALPDVTVEPGTRPTFTDAEVEAAVVGTGAADLGGLRGKVVLKARVALVRLALASVPPRADPDALIVPDHL